MRVTKIMPTALVFLIFTTAIVITAPVVHATNQAPESAVQIGFDVRPDEFNQRFVNAAQATQAPAPASEPGAVVEHQYSSTYQWQYAPRLEVIGYINNSSEKLAAVQLMTQGDGTAESGFEILTLASALVMAANGSSKDKADQKAAAEIILALLDKLGKREDSVLEVSIDDGRFLYSADQQKAAGTWFSIEKSEE